MAKLDEANANKDSGGIAGAIWIHVFDPTSPVFRRARRRFLAGMFGVLLILLLAEVSLRFVGLNYIESREAQAARANQPTSDVHSSSTGTKVTSLSTSARSSLRNSADEKALQGSKGFRIFMIGNSHTDGAGVQKSEAYPHQLQIRLRREIEAGRLKLPEGFQALHVINGGRGNVTTSQQRAKLLRGELNRDWLHPHIVIAVGGEPNIWNPVGLSLARRRMGMETTSRLSEWFSENLRVYRFVQLLRHSWHEERQQELTTLRCAIEIINRLQLVEDMNANEVASYLQRFRSAPRPRPRVVYDAWSVVCTVSELGGDCVSEVAREYLLDYPSRFNLLVFHAVDVQYDRTIRKRESLHLDELRKLHASLLANWTSLGWKVELEQVREWSLSRRYPKVETEEDFELLRATFDVHPANMVNTNYLLENLGRLKERERQLNIISQALDEVPLVIHREPLRRLRVLADTSPPGSIRDLAQHIYEDYQRKYPEDAQYEFQVNSYELTEWIRTDFELLTDDLRKRGVPVYFHSYHWLRGIPMADAIDTALMSIRNSPKPSFNLGEVFKAAVRADPNDIESYFVQSFGPNDAHPSVKGHALIADLMLDWVSELVRDFPPKDYPDWRRHIEDGQESEAQ